MSYYRTCPCKVCNCKEEVPAGAANTDGDKAESNISLGSASNDIK